MKFRSALKAQRKSMLWAFGFSVVVNLLILTGPIFMLQIYDRVLITGSLSTLAVLSFVVVVAYALLGLLDFCRTCIFTRVGMRLQDAFQTDFFRAQIAGNADLKRHHSDQSLSNLESVRHFFNSPAPSSLCDAPWAPLFLFLMFVFHPALGWVASIGCTLMILAAVLNNVTTRAQLTESVLRDRTAGAFAEASLKAGDDVVGLSLLDRVEEKWLTLKQPALHASLRASERIHFFASSSKFIRLTTQSAILACGSVLVIGGQISAGAMIAGSILLGRVLAPMEQIILQWPIIGQGLYAIRALTAGQDQSVPQVEIADLDMRTTDIAVSNIVHFAEGGAVPLLNNVTLKIPGGQVLGIIGKTGAGKSTLMRVIMGLVTPRLGAVTFAGTLLSQINRDQRRHIFGYVPQKVQLLPDTILGNIAHLSADPDIVRVDALIEQVGLGEMIANLPNGLLTQVGGAENILSGGQEQRLGLARALYFDPQILILDEPNSALDADGTDQMNDIILERKRQGKITIIATHRPNAISCCDALVVLSNGKVVMQGARDDVVQRLVAQTKKTIRPATGAS